MPIDRLSACLKTGTYEALTIPDNQISIDAALSNSLDSFDFILSQYQFSTSTDRYYHVVDYIRVC